MKKNMFLLLGIISFLFTGCAATPEKVKENMKEYGDNKQQEEDEFTYCKPSELHNINTGEIKNKYSNISISSDVEFPEMDTISCMDVEVYSDYYTDEVLDHFCDLFDVDKSEMKYAEGESYNKYKYDNEKDKYLMVTDVGIVNYYADCICSFTAGEIENQYDLSVDDISDVQASLEDGDISLGYLIDDAKKWLDDNYKIEDNEFSAADVIIRSRADDPDLDIVSISFEYLYNNVPFNEFIPDYPLRVVEIEYTKSSCLSRFTNREQLKILNSENVDKILDFDSVMKIVSKKLSGFGVMQFSDVKLAYVPFLENMEFYRGSKGVARPMYIFLSPENDTGLPSMVNRAGRYKYYFAVDAITGEYYTDLDG